jgi:hypothetical protein
MTVESCVNFCNGKNYIYAGVEYAQECCKFVLTVGRIISVASLTLPFECQTVEISSRTAQQVLQVLIAVSHVPEIRARLVVPVIALTYIGVVQHLHLHPKSCQALDCGSPWDAIRT